MLSTDFSNIARCAKARMDQLWHDACAAKGNDWKPFHQRRWREHETYMAMNDRALSIWKRSIDAMNQYDCDCY